MKDKWSSREFETKEKDREILHFDKHLKISADISYVKISYLSYEDLWNAYWNLIYIIYDYIIYYM